MAVGPPAHDYSAVTRKSTNTRKKKAYSNFSSYIK